MCADSDKDPAECDDSPDPDRPRVHRAGRPHLSQGGGSGQDQWGGSGHVAESFGDIWWNEIEEN